VAVLLTGQLYTVAQPCQIKALKLEEITTE